jgi:hypothetical protein
VARQKPTNPDTPDWTLTPQQETAVDLLVSGKTITDTATAVEVTRQTINEWLNHHPGFQAGLPGANAAKFTVSRSSPASQP